MDQGPGSSQARPSGSEPWGTRQGLAWAGCRLTPEQYEVGTDGISSLEVWQRVVEWHFCLKRTSSVRCLGQPQADGAAWLQACIPCENIYPCSYHAKLGDTEDTVACSSTPWDIRSHDCAGKAPLVNRPIWQLCSKVETVHGLQAIQIRWKWQSLHIYFRMLHLQLVVMHACCGVQSHSYKHG